MGDDWDLYAVVRSCSTAATAAEKSTFTTPPSCSAYGFSPIKFQENEQFLNFPDLQETKGSESIVDLHDMFNAFCPKLQSQNKRFCPKIQPISPQNIPISPLSVLGDLPNLSPQKKQKDEAKTTFSAVTTTPRHCSQNPRSKRRKNQIKRVCQVPVGGLSSDMWYWRKYGQKPIKGSPYPRSYYKCSTSKGCLARKQVERNRSDPDMFIVTYSAEHNHPVPTHRDSLAGSTRQKISTAEHVADGDPNKLICSTPVSPAASLSTAPEKFEVEEEDDELWASDTPLSDDFFVGLEDIKVPGAGDGAMDHFPMFSWTSNNATTTAAGGV